MGPETLIQRPAISMSAPDIDETDIEAVTEVLRSGRLALGPRAEEFEQRIAEYVGVPIPSRSARGRRFHHLTFYRSFEVERNTALAR